MNEKYIEVKNVSKHFDKVKAVDDISVEIKEGEFFFFIGSIWLWKNNSS